MLDAGGDAEPAYFIGPSNRSNSSNSINIGGRTIGRDSDAESVNEDDLEVARITKIKDSASKISLLETGKSKSFDSSETYHFQLEKETSSPRGKPPMQRTTSLGYGPKDETDEIIDSLINIYGIPCTEAMKCLKKKLQEELRRVTKDRKRKIEELEEIRALQMQIGALNLDSDTYGRGRSFTGKRSTPYLHVDTHQHDSRKRGSGQSSSGQANTRTSPQVTPRRQRHKRQSSDPMISKFSPIKEDRDIETDFQSRSQSDTRGIKYHTDDSSQSGVSDTESTRSEPIRESRHRKDKSSIERGNSLRGQTVVIGGSAERLQYSDYEQKRIERSHALSGSRSEQQLSSTSRGNAAYYSDDNEMTIREEKKALLQYEIMKRKQQLEETARLKSELLKIARTRQPLAHSYDDVSSHYSSTPSAAGHRSVPKGIIKPIDDDPSQPIYDRRHRSADRARTRSRSRERSGERSRDRSGERLVNLTPSHEDLLHGMVLPERTSLEPRVSPKRRGHKSSSRSPDPQQLLQHNPSPAHHHHNYSSTEYLAHKQETRRHMGGGGGGGPPAQYGSQPWIPGRPEYDQGDLASMQAYSQPSLNRRTDSAQSLLAARREAAQKDAGISSSVTLPNIYNNRADLGFRPPYRSVFRY